MSSTSSVRRSLVRVLQTDYGRLLGALEPVLVYACGSVVTGLADETSDYDFAVYFTDSSRDQRRRKLHAVQRVLVDHFGDRQVDVGDLHGPDSPNYLAHVVRHGLCVWARDAASQHAFEAQVLHTADEPHLRQRAFFAALKSRWQEDWAHARALEIDKLEKQLWQSELHVKQLLRYVAMPLDRFLSNQEFEHRFAAAHLLRALIESQLTLARYLIIVLGWTRSNRPADLFEILARRTVIPPALVGELLVLAAWRDPLTHAPAEIDYADLHASLPEAIRLTVAFNRHYITYLANLGI